MAGWSLDPTPAAPSAARRRAQTVLSSWDIRGEHAEDVLLVISELVANAVDHARTWLTVTIKQDAGSVLVAVSDGCDRQPQLQPHDVQARRGRGLQLIDTLSVNWGTIATLPGPGKTVWAQIAYDARQGIEATRE